MWSVHPGQRGAAFVANLPNVIAAIEDDEVPPYQQGIGALRAAWIDAVGPQRFVAPRQPWSVRRAVRGLAQAVGILPLRGAMQRAWWLWRHGESWRR
jgi:hypothetical protein